MTQTRRSFVGLALAGLPVALMPPSRLAQAIPDDSRQLLDHLDADTKQNCRLALNGGKDGARALRRLGGNLEVLAVLACSHPSASGIARGLAERAQTEGGPAMVLAVRQRWPSVASGFRTEYGFTPPQDLEPDVVAKAMQNLQRYGCPRFGGVRAWLDDQADRLERPWGGAAPRLVGRILPQTPGNDYGPPGWSAGIGDGSGIDCYTLGLLIAACIIVMEFQPELAGIMGKIAALLGGVLAAACAN